MSIAVVGRETKGLPLQSSIMQQLANLKNKYPKDAVKGSVIAVHAKLDCPITVALHTNLLCISLMQLQGDRHTDLDIS